MSSTVPDLLFGWTNVATVVYTSGLSTRLSWKEVMNGESVDPNGTSRANLRIYSNVDTADPVDDVQLAAIDAELSFFMADDGTRTRFHPDADIFRGLQFEPACDEQEPRS